VNRERKNIIVARCCSVLAIILCIGELIYHLINKDNRNTVGIILLVANVIVLLNNLYGKRYCYKVVGFLWD